MDTSNLYAAASSDGPMRHNNRNPDPDSQPYGQVSGAGYTSNNQSKIGAEAGRGDSGKMTGQTASGHPYASKTPGQSSPGEQQNTIGHYVLVKALGEGTFGKVKLGQHRLSKEKVAVKVLEKSRIKEKKDVERISREIKILKQLHHPNVVQIYEIIETEQDLYLVMEFVQGGELFDLIVQNTRLKEKQACKYFQELISGIKYIHELGICHRDLKPENLLIDYDQSLKIVDFGLSNLYEQGTTLKTACGSPCYAAPEMIAGKPYNGLMSDIWSCGVVLYAMLCGYLPFEDQKTSDLYKKILNAEYTPPDFLSPEAKDMIAKIFVTDPDKRIDINGIRNHPWYQLHRPETMGFHVCPPSYQKFQPPYIIQNKKKYSIQQRPNLLNQKILDNLETLPQFGFNKESLLKSIKNNKHNHLTATYYLLLKKHMIRQLKPYTEAFMELRPYEEPKDPARDVNKDRNNAQQPPVQLKSNKVQEALQQKRGAALADSINVTERQNQHQVEPQDQNNKQENNNNQNTDEKHQSTMKGTAGQQANTDAHDAQAQKDFRSLDHNQMAEAIMGKQQTAMIDSAKNLAKRQNYMDGGYNDYVDSSKQYTQVDKINRNQQPRDKQSSSLSKRSSHGQDLSQQDGKTKRQDEMYLMERDINKSEDQELAINAGAAAQGNNFNGQTQQSFVAKKSKPSKNAFNHRREYSANPYIGNEANQQNAQQQRSPFIQEKQMEQYQNQIDKYKKAGGPMQPQPTKTRNSRWKPQDSSVNNTQSDMSSMRSQNTKLHKKSQESIKNNQYAPLSDENHPGANPHQSDLNQLVPPSYQTQGKPRAQSYNIKRRGDNSGSLDPLEYEKAEDDPDQNQYQQIKSTNFKQATKGHHREVRAPSSGSSGSQPRVVIAGPNKEQSQGSGGQLSVNSSGVQRRYDSIEHQRQSQIDRFLQSPQEQIANMMIQKLKQQDPVPSSSKFSKKNLTVSSKDNNRKNGSETFNQGGFSHMKGNMPSQGHTTTKVQQQVKNAHPSGVPENISIQLTNLKHKKISQNAGPSQKKLRNNSKGHDDEGGPSNRYQTGPIPTLQQQMSGQSHTNYRQMQHQLALLNPKKEMTSDYSQKSKIDHLSPQDGVTILQQQYSSHLNNIQQSLNSEAMKQLNLDQNMMLSMQQQKQAQKEQMNDGSQGATAVKGNHRKAKSQLNQPNGAPTTGSGTYQHQKVQQIQMQDGSIRNLIHKIQNNNGNANQQVNSSSKTPLSTHQAPSGSSKHAVMPMPSAPKSGNVIKLKHQVIRNKSSQNNRSTTRTTETFKGDRGARGNSQTLQNTGSSANQQQTQIMLQQQLQGKKKILHTTKNTNASGQNQHNFDIVEAAKEAQATHQASVQHTSAIAPNSRKSQQTAHSIKIGATSGASIGSNFSKFTGTSSNTGPHYTQKFNSSSNGVNVPKSTGNQETTFIRSLMNQQLNQQFQLMQNKEGEGGPSINTQIMSNHSSVKHAQQHQAVPSSGGNKRGAIKVQKIQKNQMSGSNNLKANQIENIHKQISQNQKAFQNMTQGLFSKNNTGTLMMQGSASQQQSPQTMQSDQYHPGTDGKIGLNQQQIMVVKIKQKESRQNQARGANGIGHSGNGPSTNKQNAFSLSSGSSGVGMHTYATGTNAHSANYSQQSQQTSASRRYSHQDPNAIHQANQQSQSQQNPKMSQHPKIANMGHYQTQDNRHGQGNVNDDGHAPSSQGVGISTQQSYTGASFHQNTEQAKGAQGNNAIGNIEFNQNFQGNVQFKYSSKQGNPQGGQGSIIQQSKQYRNSGSMKLVKGPQGPAQNIQKGYQTQTQNSGMSSASNTHQQMTIMNKYNKQQMFKQGKMTAQETRGDRGQVKSGGANNAGPQRHYSAPREAAYGPIDEDELRRQHLLNQSLDMSQLNGIGNGALQNAKNYDVKQSSKPSSNVQKLNLGKLSHIQVQNADKSAKDQHHGQAKGHSGW